MRVTLKGKGKAQQLIIEVDNNTVIAKKATAELKEKYAGLIRESKRNTKSSSK